MDPVAIAFFTSAASRSVGEPGLSLRCDAICESMNRSTTEEVLSPCESYKDIGLLLKISRLAIDLNGRQSKAGQSLGRRKLKAEIGGGVR